MASRSSSLFGDLLARVTEVGRSLISDTRRPLECAEDLLEGRGEATGLGLAQSVLEGFSALPEDGRLQFFTELRERFGVDTAGLDAAVEQWRSDRSEANARAIHVAAEPRSQELLRRLNRAPGGTAALVEMRAHLIDAMKRDSALGTLDADFVHLFSSWFNRGFLELRRIDWHTPAAILEKIIRYEAVHEINGWDDLRQRVGAPDRRLYGFFHPALGDEPLIFVEVAFTDAMPSAIAPILAEDRETIDPEAARTAVFYSISNCQRGLRGISFGNFLIKQVVEDLRREFSSLRQFVTLSPVPGLRKWADAAGIVEPATSEDAERIAARYLVSERAPSGGALDPVARFHLGNGARLERVNPDADQSPLAIKASWGVMVNYAYDIATIETNHEAYANSGEIAASNTIRRLLR